MKALIVVVLMLLGLGVVADRAAVAVAEQQVAAQLQQKGDLNGAPSVHIGGFPFLTQALAGRYDDVRISMTAAELGQPAGTSAEVHLHGVRIPLSAVLSRSVHQVPVDRLDGTATLSYTLLADRIGPGTTVQRTGDGLRVTRTVDLLGQSVRLSAVGQLTLQGNVVRIDVQQASAAGVTLPPAVVRQADSMLNLRYPVPQLPYGLQLTGVAPQADGVRVTVEGRQTVISGG